MACVCQVKDVTIALGIEHDGILVGLRLDADEFFDDGLLLCLGLEVLLFQVDMVLGQFCPEHVERSVQVGFLEHGMGRQQAGYQQQEYDSNFLFHNLNSIWVQRYGNFETKQNFQETFSVFIWQYMFLFLFLHLEIVMCYVDES